MTWTLRSTDLDGTVTVQPAGATEKAATKAYSAAVVEAGNTTLRKLELLDGERPHYVAEWKLAGTPDAYLVQRGF